MEDQTYPVKNLSQKLTARRAVAESAGIVRRGGVEIFQESRPRAPVSEFSLVGRKAEFPPEPTYELRCAPVKIDGTSPRSGCLEARLAACYRAMSLWEGERDQGGGAACGIVTERATQSGAGRLRSSAPKGAI